MEPPYTLEVRMHFELALLLHPSSKVGPKPVQAGVTGHGVTLTVLPTRPCDAAINATMATIEGYLSDDNVGSVMGGWRGFDQPDAEVWLDEQPPRTQDLPGSKTGPAPLRELKLAIITADPRIVHWRLWTRVKCGGELFTHSSTLYTTASHHWRKFGPDGKEIPLSAAEAAQSHWRPKES
jgi:hypothetical protein